MKFDVRKYAELARIKLSVNEEEKISQDIENILDYFKELQELNTKDVEPVIGGTNLENIFREDKQEEDSEKTNKSQFSDNGYLRVPNIFE